MKLLSIAPRLSVLLAAAALCSGAMAQNAMSGHDMAGMDEHAHHHHAAMESEVKHSMLDVAVTPIALLRQDGSKTTLAKELAGNTPTILAFIYTSCTTICPVTSQILSSTQELLGAEMANVRILSISIDPEYDTPQRLSEYSKKFAAKPQWQHYTGSLANSVAVQKAFAAYRGDKMNHVPLIFVNGGGKKSWLQLEGFPKAEDLVKDLHSQMRS